MNSLFRSITASLLALIFSYVTVMTGCTYQTNVSAASQAVAPSASAEAPAQPMNVDDLVAPIALYPDQLLAQVLTASMNTQEVLDGGNWLIQNQALKGDELTNAAKAANFSPSMQYLMAFPQVVDNMCQEIDWTTQLGQAFTADQKAVMDAVQRKRTEAQQAGNLKTSPEMVVATQKAENGQQYVEIKPANPQVVYVPQYNPVTIYITPAPTTVVVAAPQTTTTTQASSGVSTGSAVAIGLLSFGVGMAIGSAMHQDNYYPYPAWGYRGIYYGGHPYYPPPYRPVYPGYRPAYGYHPPPNYHWNQYNKNVNVTVNNNYYTKYNKTTVNNRNTTVNNRNTNVNNVNRSGGNPSNSWKGQSTYQGARTNTTGQKPGASMTKANPQTQQTATRPNNANNSSSANRAPAANKTTASNRAGTANTTTTGNANRPSNGNPGSMNKASTRPAGTTTPATRPAPQQGAKTHDTSKNGGTNKNGNAKSKGTASGRGGQAGSDAKRVANQ
jgi:Protein of unknown function (DUF3300)